MFSFTSVIQKIKKSTGLVKLKLVNSKFLCDVSSGLGKSNLRISVVLTIPFPKVTGEHKWEDTQSCCMIKT